MAESRSLKGVLAPVVTPFAADLQVDTTRWTSHCRWLLSQGCGLAIFGTNSEANSLSMDERLRLLELAASSGIDTSRLMPGTGACALPDAVALTSRAVRHGCGGVLMLPPFYYKGLSEDGLFAFYSEVIQQVGDDRLRVYLYHIPQMSGVPIELDLIERLLKEYPETVVGIKDSSGNWPNTKAMLDRFDDFDIYCGSEAFLLENMRSGGAGCISATANVNPSAIVDLFDNWKSDDAEERQAKVTEFRKVIEGFPMIAALKAVIAISSGDDEWLRTRPPLGAFNGDMLERLRGRLDGLSFEMPGLSRVQ